MNLESWSFVGTVFGGFATSISIIIAILSVYWTRKFAKEQQRSADAQVDISIKTKEADEHSKQTDEYETAIALYEKATQKSIYDEISRAKLASENQWSEGEDLISTFTMLRLEQEALLLQNVLVPVSDSNNDSADTASINTYEKNLVAKLAISEAINNSLTDIALAVPDKYLSKAEDSLAKYFPTSSKQRKSNREISSLTVDSDEIFSTHAKVLNLFGFGYKQWLKGWKSLPDNYAVWFPHLNNTNRDWINTLSGSKTEITEQKKDGSFNELELADRISPPRIIRFAFAYNNWGNDTWGYKFVGAFEPDPEKAMVTV
jgi:hypothetical protein